MVDIGAACAKTLWPSPLFAPPALQPRSSAETHAIQPPPGAVLGRTSIQHRFEATSLVCKHSKATAADDDAKPSGPSSPTACAHCTLFLWDIECRNLCTRICSHCQKSRNVMGWIVFDLHSNMDQQHWPSPALVDAFKNEVHAGSRCDQTRSEASSSSCNSVQPTQVHDVAALGVPLPLLQHLAWQTRAQDRAG